jgi:hypothetical protein
VPLQAVKSSEDACNLVTRTQFNLMLSDYQVQDGRALSLLDRLVGSPATLFFSASVGRGSLCVQMLDLGQRCIGKPVFKSDELTVHRPGYFLLPPNLMREKRLLCRLNLNSYFRA